MSEIERECRDQAKWLRSEDLMVNWDKTRALIASGDRGSGPRDNFESWIDEPADVLARAASELSRLRSENERLREALGSIAQWSEAYPLTVFPEPDFKKAHEVLTAAGMTLDAISASNMRHVVMGVGKIARAALSPNEPEPLQPGQAP